MAVQPGMQELQDKKGANKGALLMLESTLISWSLNLSATLTLRLMPQVTVIFFLYFFLLFLLFIFNLVGFGLGFLPVEIWRKINSIQ